MAATPSMQPEKILKELAGLWGSMSKSEGNAGQGVNSGVLRACAMTLIVAAESEEDAMSAGEALGELMHEHPSRAIVLRPSTNPEDLGARVFAQCWMPFGKRQQICCEQIEITASMERIAEAETTILGIMAPDLPMVLWVRGGHWLQSEGFARLFPLAQKVVMDSSKCGNEEPFALIRRLQPKVKLLGDLAWTRLTSLREIIAHTFQDASIVSKLGAIDKMIVEYTDHPIAANYLAGWLSGAVSPSVQIEVRQKQGEFDTVQLTGEGLDIRIELGTTANFRINGLEYRTMLPVPTEVSIMREELSILRKDRVFEAALAAAEKL
ncbi:glucose-6-phosphate dehydrogenase assembly protein OpcA [Bryobacterales bacterium F-183]|nr:glucose-6-phosphate dehydrogenase assembly protein OpcA [Bryobacterales bacterium F-183]